MRVFSYILTALVTIFVINIALSFSLPVYRNTLVSIRTSVFPSSEKAMELPVEDEKTKENTRLVESLDRIDKHIESLSEAKKTGTGMVNEGSGSVNTLSGEETHISALEIPLS